MEPRARRIKNAMDVALTDDLPRLPPHRLQAYLERFIPRREQFLSLTLNHPSPLYVFDVAAFREKAKKFRGAFERKIDDVECYFAVKSNNHEMVAKAALENGYFLDVSSGMELELAVSCGAQKVLFSGPGKTDHELESAVHHANFVTVLMDSFVELRRLNAIAQKAARIVNAGVRLTTNPKGLWRKFGIPLEQLNDFLAELANCPFVNFQGLQFHTSWNLHPDAQLRFIENLGQTLSLIPSYLTRQIEFIDVGGGYWPEDGEWLQAKGTWIGAISDLLALEDGLKKEHFWLEASTIDTFARELGAALKKELSCIQPFRVMMEPGRWLCHDAVHLILTVVDKKGTDIVITDGGTNAIGWERFETDFFPVINLTRPASTERACHVLGALCTPHDVWGYSYFGEDIRIGDVLLIPSQGAYTYSLRQNFIKPIPDFVRLES